MPRVLVLNYEYPPLGGGGGVASEYLADALVRDHGFEITVLTAGVGRQVETTRSAAGTKVIRIPCARTRPHRSSATNAFMLRYVLRAIGFVRANRREFGADCVHSHFAVPTGLAGLGVARALGRPHVLTLIGGEVFEQPLETRPIRSWWLRRLVRRVIDGSQIVTAISSDTRAGAIAATGTKTPIEVLTLGYARPAGPRTRRRPAPGPVRIVAVSRLVERKGYDVLFDALAGLPRERWRLTVVGDGPLQGALEQRAARLGIGDQVRFTGYVSEAEKMRALADADLFALASLHEGLGLVYFEAMDCGLPIVTTNHGGQTDFLADPRNALLVPPGDATALRNALERAISDASWREAAGAANAADIERQTLRHVVPKYAEMLTRAAEMVR